MNKKNLNIGVITVCFNEIDNIDRTLDSIQNQSYEGVHTLIVDGGSTDGTLDAIKKRYDRHTKLHTGKDKGIFDAMNIGLDQHDADWFVFMNAGDTFASDKVVEQVADSIINKGNSNTGVVYGHYNNNSVKTLALDPSMLQKGMIITCHQSMFFKSTSIRYDISMPLYADFEYLCQYEREYEFLFADIVMSNFSPGGVSEPPTWQKRSDKFRAVYRHFGLPGIFSTTAHSILVLLSKLKMQVTSRY